VISNCQAWFGGEQNSDGKKEEQEVVDGSHGFWVFYLFSFLRDLSCEIIALCMFWKGISCSLSPDYLHPCSIMLASFGTGGQNSI
jgi:hypothetical protein